MHRFAITLEVRISLLAIGLVLGSFAAHSMAAPPAARQLAPGVLTTIPPNFEPDDTVSTHDIVEIRANPALQWKPEFMTASRTLYGMADKVKFRRDDLLPRVLVQAAADDRGRRAGRPAASERKLVWYLVYRVRNTGQVLKPVEGDDGVFTAELAKGGPVRFLPQFVLESQDRQADGERDFESVSRSRDPGRRRRDQPARNARPACCSTASRWPSSRSPSATAASTTACGAWRPGPTSIRGSISFRSTSAASRTPIAGTTRRPRTSRAIRRARGRRFTRKTLQLNFWRPGDELQPNEREIRFGVPRGKADLYDVAEGVAYRWVYR